MTIKHFDSKIIFFDWGGRNILPMGKNILGKWIILK